ncbi:MAG: class I SAM-dependent methyltransferase, partial [Bacteroidota bacterium]
MSQLTKTQPLVSPINQQGVCQAVDTISVAGLRQKYQELYQLDITPFVESLEEITIYECPYTGYQFFHPFSLAGDGPFYEHLEQYPWYYLPWKWEHEKSLGLLQAGQKVLEIGCGQGSFIAKLQSEGYEATGLELNEHGVALACEQGLDVRGELVQDHALVAANQYDLVCSFQVLEHIADIQSFIQAKLDCLKVGGKLIVAVPNNDSFIKDANWNVLN